MNTEPERITSTRDDVREYVRMPLDIRKYIDTEALRHGRSKTAQINLMLRKAMSMPAANDEIKP